MPVPKKDGKVRMCVDYRDLNRASPRDDFPLPHIEMLVDNTAGHAFFSFMDGFSGYNQIKMAEEDREKTTFITEWSSLSVTPEQKISSRCWSALFSYNRRESVHQIGRAHV